MTANESNIVGQSPELMRVLNAARMVACTEANVLIEGEVGCGKELLGREIHGASRRRQALFSVIDCALVSAEQLEQGLLHSGEGESEGSETIRIAKGGTLFLNEVGELSPDCQTRLLHFLERRSSDGYVDLRVIAATSVDLYAQVQAGVFREDLYFLLNVVPLQMPPLRERGDDIVLLLKRFSADLAQAHGRRAPSYAMSARRVLKTYHWPGNVRELRNLCERMVILLPGRSIQPENLPPEIQRGSSDQGADEAFKLPRGGIDLMGLESSMIRQALGMSGGNRSKAARLLGITRDTLLYRIQKHSIET